MPETAMISEISTSDTHLIWQEFSDRLRTFIVRRVGSAADADDILQEVFLRIHQHAGGINRSDRLTSWLFQVTRNAITDYYRSPVRREQPASVASAEMLTWTEAAAAEIDHDPEQVHEELASCLRPMIARLPPHYREAVSMVDLTELTHGQAAMRLGLSVSGMKSRVQRGRRALKDLLVDCCPVQLDPGGRIVDYDRPGPACTTCAGAGADTTPVAVHANQHGGCCAPPVPQLNEPQLLDIRSRSIG